MAENAPPANTANNAPDASRGMPYYEKLRRDLRESLQKKRQIDASLAQLEEQILNRETAYLEETSAGNIIKGFDNYIKGTAASTTSGTGGPTTRRKAVINDADRIFSRSSASFVKESSAPGSAVTTPSLIATPSASGLQTRENSQGASTNKSGVGKNKKARDDDDSEGKPAKRGKISYGRD